MCTQAEASCLEVEKALPIAEDNTQVKTVNVKVKAMKCFVLDTTSSVRITFKSRFDLATAWICKFMEYLTLS